MPFAADRARNRSIRAIAVPVIIGLLVVWEIASRSKIKLLETAAEIVFIAWFVLGVLAIVITLFVGARKAEKERKWQEWQGRLWRG